MEFKNSLKIKSDYIEELLKKYMPKEDGYQSKIMESMNYSLKAGGKRLRPILTLEACKIVGGNEEDAIPFAMAIEMIHTYSLIHDDLPAMDTDDYRRGRLTNHKVYGEAMAVLAGDALLTDAFVVAASAKLEKPENTAFAVSDLGECAGSLGMDCQHFFLRAFPLLAHNIQNLTANHTKRTGAFP